jgi:polysaccharide export outer membrane protein
LLHPGNRLTITFSGTPLPPPKHEEKIREDGTITPPQLDKPVQAAGLTVGELQDALHKAYVPAYYKSLTVTVAAEERFFYVAGEVKTPGRLLYLSRMTVLRAVQAAGDFTDFASRKNVEVIRANGKVERVNCIKAGKDPRLDKPIYPDDTVRVRRRLM